jgi:hypothetical protein
MIAGCREAPTAVATVKWLSTCFCERRRVVENGEERRLFRDSKETDSLPERGWSKT